MKFAVGKVLLHFFVKSDQEIVNVKYCKNWSSFSTASMMLNLSQFGQRAIFELQVFTYLQFYDK